MNESVFIMMGQIRLQLYSEEPPVQFFVDVELSIVVIVNCGL